MPRIAPRCLLTAPILILLPITLHAQCPIQYSHRQTITAGAEPQSLAAADLNNDRFADLVVADTAGGNILVFIGQPTADFPPPTILPATGAAPRAVAIADLNADGHPDIAAANAGSANVSVYLGDGNGAFQSLGAFAVGPEPSAIAIADVNRDQRPDIIVANAGASTLSILLGNGDGTFAAAQQRPLVGRPCSIVTADVNQDGDPDIIVGLNMISATTILLGNGDASFTTSATYTYTSHVDQVLVGNLNNDPHLDLCIVFSSARQVRVQRGFGDGTFVPPVTSEDSTTATPTSAAIGDLNGDGLGDLAIAYTDASGGSIEVFTTHVLGAMFPAQTIRLPETSPIPRSLTLTHLTPFDPRVDLIIANPGEGAISTITNHATVQVTFQPASGVYNEGEEVSLFASASLPFPLQYQWYRGHHPIADDGRITGATTSTLRISPCQVSDIGRYSARIFATGCSAYPSFSQAAVVAIIPRPTCPADLDRNGAIDSSDFFAFLASFFAGCP